MMLGYEAHLNRYLRSPEDPVTVDEILADSENVQGYDLDEGGYSLAAQLTFDYDQCPVTLIGFFDHSDYADLSAGIHMTLLMAAADSSTWQPIYALTPIPEQHI